MQGLENRALVCPQNGVLGRPVELKTVKSLLTHAGLADFEPAQFWFCQTPDCPVVYYSPLQTFDTTQLRVPVFQKMAEPKTPICYCFGFTREEAIHHPEIVNTIEAHIKAKRCACDLRNPQGSCCLTNLKRLLAQ
jgi:Zinc binding domain